MKAQWRQSEYKMNIKEELEKAVRIEKFRIFDGILKKLKGFLKRPKMYASSVEATYTTFVTLISCLDVVADNKGRLIDKHRKFMVLHKDPGALVYPSGITQNELIEHFQHFYDTHIVVKIGAAALNPGDFTGPIPARQEFEILGPDKPNEIKLGWFLDEKMGNGYSNKGD